MTSSLTREEAITNVYNAKGENSRLNVTVAKYSLRGELLSFDAASGLTFQMCDGALGESEAAFAFGTRYEKKCKMSAAQLFSRPEPEFFDLYIPYKVGKLDKMFAVPMLSLNDENNKAKDDQKWTFTSRFFLVDTASGVSVAGSGPERIRYLTKMHIQVQLLNSRENPEKAGRIFPPIVFIEYGEISSSELKENPDLEVDFEFGVTFKMDLKEGKKDIEVRDFYEK